MACLRWSREVRSRIRTPSRWSISCWMTRASRPLASITSSLAVARRRRARGRRPARSTSTSTRGQREAALLDELGLLAGPLEHRVDERVDRRVRLDAVDEHAARAAELRGGQADARAPRSSARPSRRPRCAAPRRSSATSSAPRLEHGIAPLAHVAQRRLAAGLDLGRQLGALADLALEDLFVVLGHRGPRLLRIDVDRESRRRGPRRSARRPPRRRGRRRSPRRGGWP